MCLGIPGLVVGITDARNKLGLVDVCGVRRQINLACVIGAGQAPVHVGFAMSRIDETEARLTLELLEQLGEAQSELAALRAGTAEH